MTTKGIITLYIGEDQRIIDRVTRFVIDTLKLLSVDGYWTIQKTETKEVIGLFVSVIGFTPIVKLFEFLTDHRGIDYQSIELHAE